MHVGAAGWRYVCKKISGAVVIARTVFLAALFLAASGELAAAKPTYVSFAVEGAFATTPEAINRAGTVAGVSDFDNTFGGFVRTADGTITSFAVTGSTSTIAKTLDDNGTIAGAYYTSGLQNGHGFVRAADGSIITLDPTGTVRNPPRLTQSMTAAR